MGNEGEVNKKGVLVKRRENYVYRVLRNKLLLIFTLVKSVWKDLVKIFTYQEFLEKLGQDKAKYKPSKLWEKICIKYSPFSQFCLRLSESKLRDFQNLKKFYYKSYFSIRNLRIFITLNILLNSFLLCFYNYSFRIDPMEEKSLISILIDDTEYYFLSVYMIEAFLKMFGGGVIFGKKAYFSQGWNYCEFFIIICGIMTVSPELPDFPYLRPVRFLRTIRSIKMIPGMDFFLNSLILSIPGLLNVILLLIFFIFTMGIIGNQIFAGLLENRCRLTVIPSEDDSWPVDSNQKFLCGSKLCPEKTYCGNPSYYGVPANYTEYNIPELTFGVINFDDIMRSSLIVFTTLTTEGWTDNLYLFWNAYNTGIVIIYFSFLIIFGNFFLMNLILAAIHDSFTSITFENQANKEAASIENIEVISRSVGQQSLPQSPLLEVKNSTPNIENQTGNLNLNIKLNSSDKFPPIIKVTNKSNEPSMSKRLSSTSIPSRVSGKIIYTLAFKLCNSFPFILFFITLVLFNSFILMIDQYPDDDKKTYFMNLVIFYSTGLFIIELLIKLTAYGFSDFIREKYNMLELLVITMSSVEYFLSGDYTDVELSDKLKVFRALRIFRIFQFSNSWKSIRVILKTLTSTIWNMVNLTIFLLLFIIVFALIGMELFAYRFLFDENGYPIADPPSVLWVAKGGPGWQRVAKGDNSLAYRFSGNWSTNRWNFDTFINSLLTVVALIIGDDWNTMLFTGIRTTDSITSQIYFITVYSLGNLVLLNLFLANIINQFSEISGVLTEQENKKKLLTSQNDWMQYELIKKLNWIGNKVLEMHFWLKITLDYAKRKILFNDNSVDKKSEIVKAYIHKAQEKKKMADEIKKEKELRMYRAKNRFASKILNLQDLQNLTANQMEEYERNSFNVSQNKRASNQLFTNLPNVKEQDEALSQESLKEIKKELFPGKGIIQSPKLDFEKFEKGNFSFDADISPIFDIKTPSISNNESPQKKGTLSDFSEASPNHFPNIGIIRKKLSTDLDIKATMEDINRIERIGKKGFDDTEVVFFEEPRKKKSRKFEELRPLEEFDEAKEDNDELKTTKENNFIDNPLISFDNPNIFKASEKVQLQKVSIPGQVMMSAVDEVQENNIGPVKKFSSESKESLNMSPEFRIKNSSKSSSDEISRDLSNLGRKASGRYNSPLNLKGGQRYGSADRELRLFPQNRIPSSDSSLNRKESNDSDLFAILALKKDISNFSNFEAELKAKKEESAESDIRYLQQRKDISFDTELFVLNNRKDLSIDSDVFSLKRPAFRSRDNDLQEKKLNASSSSSSKQNIRSTRFQTIYASIAKNYKLQSFFRKKQKKNLSLKEKSEDKKNYSRFTNKELSFLIQFQKELAAELKGKSLFFLGPRNPFRKMVADLLRKEWFENFFIFLLLLSLLPLCLASPMKSPDDWFNKILEDMNIGINILFMLESFMKIIVFGFLFNGKRSYLRNYWNLLDFFIISFNFISLLNIFDDYDGLRSLRIVRLLRTIRLISKNDGLKISINTLILSIPSVFKMIFISYIYICFFSLMTIFNLKGAMYYCDKSNISNTSNYKIIEKSDCLDWGGDWINKDTNVDNIFSAVRIMFSVANTETWSLIMFDAIDSVGINQEPILDHNKWWALFFVIYVILTSFLLFNIFAGIVVQTYDTVGREQTGLAFLTEPQIIWIKAQFKILNTPLSRRVPYPTNRFRRKIYDIVYNSNKLEIFIIICIMMNLIVFALNYHRMPGTFDFALQEINLIFLVIFTTEAALKIVAFGGGYFYSVWNRFDFIILLSSYLGVLLDALNLVDNINSSLSTLRVFRVARLYKIISTAKTFRTIIKTVIIMLPSLANIGSLILLTLLVYSIIGVNIFSYVRFGKYINENANFQSFGNSFLTLLRASTGENWPMIMADCIRKRQANFICYDIKNFKDYELKGLMGCGADFGGTFFLSFQFLFVMVVLNLFVAVILQAFNEARNNEGPILNEENIKNMINHWKIFDPKATGLLSMGYFDKFMHSLGPPFGLDLNQKPKLENSIPNSAGLFFRKKPTKLEIYSRLGLPAYKLNEKDSNEMKYFHLYDVMLVLSKKALFEMEKEKFQLNTYEDLDPTHEVGLMKALAKIRNKQYVRSKIMKSEEENFDKIFASYTILKFLRKNRKKIIKKISLLEKEKQQEAIIGKEKDDFRMNRSTIVKKKRQDSFNFIINEDFSLTTVDPNAQKFNEDDKKQQIIDIASPSISNLTINRESTSVKTPRFTSFLNLKSQVTSSFGVFKDSTDSLSKRKVVENFELQTKMKTPMPLDQELKRLASLENIFSSREKSTLENASSEKKRKLSL